MSTLQRETISKFLEVVGKKTMTEYSDMTGIERTRIFRLLRGSDMRVSEFEILNEFILRHSGEVIDWKGAVNNSSFCRAMEHKRIPHELGVQMERHHRLNEIINNLPSFQKAA